MKIHECARCEGCGYITGSFRWEIPWSRWARPQDSSPGSVLEAQPCPDCGGTGALILQEGGESAEPKLASRRGLSTNSYARHVATVLRTQHLKH